VASLVPVRRVTVLDGHRTVICPNSKRTNSLDQSGR
jgi:hypothetical protein